MIQITHFDDGKEEFNSHEVSCVDSYGNLLRTVDFNIYGYGETYYEALEDFKKKFDKQMARLLSFEKMLFETDALVPIEVDCLGNKIVGEKRRTV